MVKVPVEETVPVKKCDIENGDGEATRPSSPANGRVEGVKRVMAPRHTQMIAIGGILGSGLFIGTGGALSAGGPVGILLGYIIMGGVVFATMVALGEMAALYPLSGGFVYYATRFVDPALGFTVGWNYWYELAITLPAEITAGSIVVSYWPGGADVPVAVWVTMFLVVISATNFFGARVFGEVEFWLASLKVITAVGLIILGIVIDLGGAPNHDRLGFRYWKDPGAFNQLNGIPGAKGRFLAFWGVFVQAAFSYLGTEVIALTAAEAENPRKSIPRATKTVFWRIAFFYVLGVFVIGLTVPFTDERLLDGSGTATASPFVIAIENSGIKVLPSIVNTVILLSSFSAGNSYLYAASRTLYSLACDRQAPRIFAKVTAGGLPIVAVAITVAFGALAYMNVSTDGGTVFDWLYTLSSITGILTWMAILVTYLRFRAGAEHQGVDRSTFPYQAPFQPYLSWVGLFFLFLVVLFNGFEVFLTDSWSTSDFISAYISVPIFGLSYAFWKFYKKTKLVTLDAMDFSGRREGYGEMAEENIEEKKTGVRGAVQYLMKGIWE
ncbi:amino acid permease/ SLC12A domain-containing protein [Leucosporidium creatinivorum]|uniref:Amino acid permease/ SLC12A domain-containing protein n=1 Tax=Leucosporidium creatinivorum TaxID=106004 RepID=A0A1Y2G4A6_9BASI|nr:amino acid permease/ SLC12A domain-containing protein [Leucosporidium creatinivorum]